MLKSTIFAGSVAALALFASTAQAQEDRVFSGIFNDHMVIQRGEPVTFHGTGDGSVEVTFNGKKRTVRARDGKWQARFDAVSAPGPYQATAIAGDRSETLEDILAGDVWLCSGQSNMEYPVNRALNPGYEIAASNDEQLRIVTIEKESVPAPLDDFPKTVSWAAASPETVPDFSALCLFTGRQLRASEDVPIGLIDSSWGGSQIEAWMTTDKLRETGLVNDRLDMLQTFADDPDRGIRMLGEGWESWWNDADTTPDVWEASADDIAGWTPVPEFSSWTSWEGHAISTHTGLAWFGTSVALTEDQAASVASISVGGIDEVDMTWVNGKFLKGTFGWGTERTYDVPDGLFTAGENTIVVSVYNSWGAGGMTGPAENMVLTLDDGTEVPIAEGWHYDVVDEMPAGLPRAPWESVGGLTGIGNAMIAPLGEFPMTGALWYQGESDTGEPETYEAYLDGLISGWREDFGEDLAVVIIQLANYGGLQAGPVESGWAGVRDAERRVAAKDPRTGLVVAIDAGNPRDIHPADKQILASRAAKVARAIAYGESDLETGPMPVSAERSDGKITIRFEEVAGSLRAINAAGPTGLELCSADGCRFVEGRVAGNELTISSDDVAGDRVRYCWADAPLCNLYDDESQPATPFELAIDD